MDWRSRWRIPVLLFVWHLFHRCLQQSKKSDPNSFLGGKSASEKQRQKRGSWGGNVCQMTHLMLLWYLMYIFWLYLFLNLINNNDSNSYGVVSWKESHLSIKSTSSVELGSICRHMEVSTFIKHLEFVGMLIYNLYDWRYTVNKTNIWGDKY